MVHKLWRQNPSPLCLRPPHSRNSSWRVSSQKLTLRNVSCVRLPCAVRNSSTSRRSWPGQSISCVTRWRMPRTTCPRDSPVGWQHLGEERMGWLFAQKTLCLFEVDLKGPVAPACTARVAAVGDARLDAAAWATQRYTSHFPDRHLFPA